MEGVTLNLVVTVVSFSSYPIECQPSHWFYKNPKKDAPPLTSAAGSLGLFFLLGARMAWFHSSNFFGLLSSQEPKQRKIMAVN